MVTLAWSHHPHLLIEFSNKRTGPVKQDIDRPCRFCRRPVSANVVFHHCIASLLPRPSAALKGGDGPYAGAQLPRGEQAHNARRQAYEAGPVGAEAT